MSLRSSGTCCAVTGCTNNQIKLNLWLKGKCVEHGLKPKQECSCPPRYSFYRLPKDEEPRRMWLKYLNLKHPPKVIFVCSFHFVDRKPTEEHPYPTLWLGYYRQEKTRRVLKRRFDSSVTRTDASNNSVAEGNAALCHEEPVSEPLIHHNYFASPIQGQSLLRHQATQCSGPAELHRQLLRTNHLSLLYSGLPLKAFNFLADRMTADHINTFQLDARDQVLMTLMKIRLNLLQADLAERFHVSRSEVSEIMSMWLDIMEKKLRCYIPWLPLCSNEHYPSATCATDHTNTPFQTTHNLDSRGEAHRHYYEQNAIKYLVVIERCGMIMFVSAAYGGRCSDKFITSDSGFLECLYPGDVAMEDQEFVISDLQDEQCVKPLIPAFTELGLQLSEDTTQTRCFASVHVEKVIRRLKNFRILSQTIPMTLAHQCDKILRICAALVNLQKNIFHEDEKD